MNDKPTPLGPYTMEIHDHYIAYRKAKYLIDHPGVSERKANKYARVAWARKVKKATTTVTDLATPNSAAAPDASNPPKKGQT
jgi:L-amino acid N-acyltransferase YncA